MFDIQKLYWKDQLEYLHCGVILYLSYLLAVIFCVSKPGTNGHFWPWWFVSTRGKERELFFSFFFFWREVGAVGRAEKVEWGHQVGNLWPSLWCYPCVCFHERNPRRHVRWATHVRTHTATWKEKRSATHVKSQSIANLAFGQYLWTNWQMSKGFDGRVLEEEGGTNTDVL